MSDARIAHALQRGADGALDVVFSNYAPELYDYCLTFFADPDAAADALHEAMLVAASWAPNLSDRHLFRIWLYAIARNECLRKLRRNSGPSIIGFEANLHASKAPAAPNRGRTDPILREVTDLVNRHGFGAADIALVLGIPVRRSRVLCMRSSAVLTRDSRAADGIGRQARPPIPHELRHRVLTSASMPSRVAYRGELALPRLRSGFPVPLEHAGGRRRRTSLFRVAAGIAMIAGLAVAVAIPSLSRQSVLGLVQATSPINDPSSSLTPEAPVDAPLSPSPRTVPTWERAPSDGDPDRPNVRKGQITGLDAKCIDVRGSSDIDGTPINLFPCNSTTAQQWTIVRDGTFRAFDKCMAAFGQASGSAVQLVTCSGAQAEQWDVQSNGTLRNLLSGRCLEVPGANPQNFTVLTVGECSGADNQVWRLPV